MCSRCDLDGRAHGVARRAVLVGAGAAVASLAIPRRVYTQSHIDYLVEAILEVNARKESLRGLRMTHEPPYLRHFTAKFEPL